MKRIPEKLHALAATARIANVPSVAVNVFLGIALASAAGYPNAGGMAAAFLVVSGICLYLAGNFLNDWADRRWDETHRPERALPRRIFRPRSYFLAAAGFGLLAFCSALAAHLHGLIVAIAIGICIVIYTRVHKRAAWSVIPMGLCRALLPALGFAGFTGVSELPPVVIACGCGLFCHIVGLSLSARCEAMDPAPAGLLRFARLWFVPAAVSMFLATSLGLAIPLAAGISGLLPYLLWTAICLTVFRKPVHRLVSNLLAGIPLVDWIVLLPLALSPAVSGGFSTVCLIGPPLAFLAAMALQRLAPAT